MFVLPHRYVNQGDNIQNEVCAVASLQNSQDFVYNLLFSEKHLIECRIHQGMLKEEVIAMVNAVDKQVFI
jgi:hypothetical protein